MNYEQMASHELYLALCRMENQGLCGTDDYHAARTAYGDVMRREQAEIWGADASRDSQPAQEGTDA